MYYTTVFQFMEYIQHVRVNVKHSIQKLAVISEIGKHLMLALMRIWRKIHSVDKDNGAMKKKMFIWSDGISGTKHMIF